MAPSVSMFAFILIAASTGVCEAAHGMRGAHSAAHVSLERVSQQLKHELQALLGHGESHDRLARLEASLSPTFNALPKTADGGLEEGIARYALHRYFGGGHGWQVQGLDKPKSSGNSSSTEMLKSKVPSLVLDLIEQHMDGRSLGLSELAVLAATVEDLVFSDAVELLSTVYDIDSSLNEQMLMRGYLLLYAMPNLRTAVNTSAVLRRLVNRVHKYFPAWEDFVLWAQDLKETLRYRNEFERKPFLKTDIDFTEFSAMGQFAQSVTEQFGRFQDVECKALKNKLISLEDEGRQDGRVELSKFYSAYLQQDTMYFSESTEYLRHFGVLDETDPLRPSVMIANYVYGESNCIATSGFMSVCCINHCDSLMTTLESSIAKPAAPPGVIAEIVAGMATDTVAAPRNLSSGLLRRLDDIADKNGGQVPLHGRLFAQWMHHAFPNECAFPSGSGMAGIFKKSGGSLPDGVQLKATDQEMKEVVDNAQWAGVGNVTVHIHHEPQVPWIEDEQLLTDFLTDHLRSAEERPGVQSILRWIAVVGAIASSAKLLVGSWRLNGKQVPEDTLPHWLSGGRHGFGKSHLV